MVRCARPRGTLILKSRHPGPIAFDLRAALRKELTFRAVHYGSFRKAVALLAEGRLDLTGLLGPAHPLEDFERVFALARQNEAAKLFFQVAE
jgi:threonine dehydrogenase-like Zn-dependent dehydrogenase